MAFDRLKTHLEGPFHAVDGWCSAQLWQVMQPILEFQNAAGVHNPIAEIGVYQGKFFLGLIASKNAPKGNLAIDVFDLQQFNLDGAGAGNRERLLDNAVKHGFGTHCIDTLERDSMTINATDIARILDKSGGFSLFSVDGCHLPEHTVNDMEIAMALTVPEGLIFLDDYTNPDWPGVQEGAARLYSTTYPKFVPLCVAHNKMFLCHISYHTQYLELISSRMSLMGIHTKLCKRFGYDNLTIHLDPNSTRYLYEPVVEHIPEVEGVPQDEPVAMPAGYTASS